MLCYFHVRKHFIRGRNWILEGNVTRLEIMKMEKISFLIYSDPLLKIAQKMHNILILLVVLSAVLSNASDKTSYAQLNK